MIHLINPQEIGYDKKITLKIPCLLTMKKNAFVHVVARVKKTVLLLHYVPPHLEIVIRQKGIDADVSQSATQLNLTLGKEFPLKKSLKDMFR